MKHLISSRTALCLCGLTLCFNASAQGYVSYNHDAAKMNQITVQEIGSGGLTPAFYYDALHNSYQKTAAKKNKQFFRTMAGVSAYQQVDVADSIKASLTQRAEIEALNIADRPLQEQRSCRRGGQNPTCQHLQDQRDGQSTECHPLYAYSEWRKAQTS